MSAADTDLLQGKQAGFDVGADRDDYNNQLLIRTGWCQYDIDVLRLNNLVLVHK